VGAPARKRLALSTGVALDNEIRFAGKITGNGCKTRNIG
jgi:hypothetical protein